MNEQVGGSREIGGSDPIDAEVRVEPLAGARVWLSPLLSTRAALGLRPAAAPAIVFVPLGILLGPHVLDLLSMDALSHLDTVVSVGLAALGVFVGLALDLRGRGERRLLAAASAEAAVAVSVVSAAAFTLVTQWQMPLDTEVIVVALSLGVCASASSAGVSEAIDDPVHRTATRIADLDDVLPIVIGGFALALFQVGDLQGSLRLAAVTSAIGLTMGVAGWLLFERAHGPAERGVFVVGILMLVGGSCAYLNLSPMLAGMMAGLFWTFSPGRADQIIRSDLRKLQHPLVVLLLVAAGAVVDWSREAVWLFGLFVIFRLIGKLCGGWLASRIVGDVAPADLGAYLTPPGVFGIAFALNLLQVLPSHATVALISAVSAGSLVSEALAVPALRLAESD